VKYADMGTRCTQPICRLSLLLRQRGIAWSDLGRRAALGPGVVRRLRTRHANPKLTTAYRVAETLGVTVEALWRVP